MGKITKKACLTEVEIIVHPIFKENQSDLYSGHVFILKKPTFLSSPEAFKVCQPFF